MSHAVGTTEESKRGSECQVSGRAYWEDAAKENSLDVMCESDLRDTFIEEGDKMKPDNIG